MFKRMMLIGLAGLSAVSASLMLVYAFRTSASSSTVLISAVYYATYFPDGSDQAFRLTNVSAAPLDLTGWTASDGEHALTLTGSIDAGASLWIAREALSFTLEFGYSPTYEYGSDSDPAVPDLAATGSFALARASALTLRDSADALIDSVVWAGGSVTGTGWSGTTIVPYDRFPIEGQILYRKLDLATGQPVPDTDAYHDWAQAADDNLNGKKVMYPGWNLERYFQTAKFTQTAVITYLIAPDNIFENIRTAISSATTSIHYEGYTFDNAGLGQALAARAADGVSVTILLEGSPPGGIGDQERWICQQIENAGGQCWFTISDLSASPPIHARYASQQARFMLIDDRWLLSGSNDLSYDSMPSDDKADGTSGARGVWLWTDASGPITQLHDVFEHDLDPAHQRDLKRWNSADPIYGAPPITFTASYTSGGTAYTVQFTQPIVLSDTFNVEIVQSPENSLREVDSLLGLIKHAGSGDQVLAEQFREQKYWGVVSSTPITDPNPRLEAYLAAARRGATVRLLLDKVPDDPIDPRGNLATCAYVNAIALSERLDLACGLGNPTGMGIHNGIVLVRAGRQGWVHTGSLDGSESSSKVDRAVAIQISSTHAFDALAQVFWTDYALSGGPAPYYPAYLPLVLQEPTPTPQPDGAWLAYVNDQRGLADLSPVAENPTWSDGDWKHSRYMVKNDYLGHSEDLDNPWYTPEGLAAAQNGNAFVSSSTSSTDKYAIDFWMQSPFHAVAIVDPALQQVGFGSYREAIGRRHMGATLDVYRGLGTIPPTVTFPIEYPADGKTTALRSYMGGEWPDPLTSCPGYSAPAGLPVILQIGPGNLTPSVTAHSFEQGGAPLEHCEFDATNYINPDNYTQRVGRSVLSLRDAIVLIPRAPLTPGASYAVSVTSNGQTYVWTFGVATTARQIEPPVMALAR